ncbi:hypothetical protein Q8F55_000829 [Vanrija albida]|uniref:Uncharacterized protein n=1 Tax=Vanrija albida TaxID=181172 RepID=A0ABR3QEF0_9TREE
MISAPVGMAGLGSPFSTPRAQRFASGLDVVSPSLSTPLFRPRTPLGPSLLNSSPVAVKADPRDTPVYIARKPKATPPTSMNDLPVELIQDIHLLAGNPHFPTVNQHVHDCLTGPSPTYVAGYMLHLYRDCHTRDILPNALRHRLVDIAVAEEMRRLWDNRRGYVPSHQSYLDTSPRSRSPSRTPTVSVPSTPEKQPKPKRPALSVHRLPRRIFRNRPGPKEPAVAPIIKFLFERYAPEVNGGSGYALQRAVLNGNYDLVEYLLRRGADPTQRDRLAITLAIRAKDLKMIKLLVEPLHGAGTFKEEGDSPSTSRGKKRKVIDRVKIDSKLVREAMSAADPSEDIIQYFVHEKGAMPPLNEIMALGRE